MDRKTERLLENKMYYILRGDGPLLYNLYRGKVLESINKIQEQLVEKINVIKNKRFGFNTSELEIQEYINEDNFNRKLRELYTKRKVDWLKRHPVEWGIGTEVYYYFPGQESLLEQKTGIRINKVPISVRAKHTLSIKNEIILPWLKDIPSDRIFENIVFHNKNYKSDLPLEKELLFSDFINNHLKFDDPYNLWNCFKLKTQKLRNQKEKIMDLINGEISEIIGHNITENNENVPEWIKRDILRLLWSRYTKGRLRIFPTFRSSIEHKGKNNIFYLILPDFDTYLRWKKMKNYPNDISELKYSISISQNVKKGVLDRKIKNLPEELFKLKIIETALDDIFTVKDEILQLLDEIKNSLEKHSKLELLPGECEYIL